MFIISGDVFTEGGKDIAFSNYSASWKFHRKIAGKALRFFVIYYYINDILIICVDLKNIKTKFSCIIKKDYKCLIYDFIGIIYKEIYWKTWFKRTWINFWTRWPRKKSRLCLKNTSIWWFFINYTQYALEKSKYWIMHSLTILCFLPYHVSLFTVWSGREGIFFLICAKIKSKRTRIM